MKNKKISQKEIYPSRIIFKNSKDRDNFFLKLKTYLGSWKNLQTYLKIYRSRLECFRKGTISLPYNNFINLISFLSIQEKQYFVDNTIMLDNNWGKIKGGKATYLKYKHVFDEGRKLGRSKSRYSFNINTELSPDICELIGAFIGDGFTNQYKNSYIIQFTGDAILDENYLTNKLRLIIKNMSPNSNPILKKYDRTLRLTINSKDFFFLLTKRFKFIPGKKAYSVKIPDEIINHNDTNLINKCIRGVFDTDGCVAFDKRESYKRKYIRITLNMRSKELIKQIHIYLLNHGISSTITRDYEVIQINGYKNCKIFVEKIGFSNKRHLDKIVNIF